VDVFKKEMKIKIWTILIIIVLLIITGIFYLIKNSENIGVTGFVVGSTHDHANFMVFINGEEINFALPQYIVKAKEVHIEDMNGNVIHKHATGITLGYFFKTLGFKFDENCFVFDNKKEYCNEGDKALKFYVNGERNYEYDKYEIRNLDKYLISYGNDSEEEIKKQLSSI